MTCLRAVGRNNKSEEAADPGNAAVALEELMNIPISSASKKDESLFDAPVSSYTITRAEMAEKAGSGFHYGSAVSCPGAQCAKATSELANYDHLTFVALITHYAPVLWGD